MIQRRLRKYFRKLEGNIVFQPQSLLDQLSLLGRLDPTYPATWIAVKRDQGEDSESYYDYYTGNNVLSGYNNWALGEPNLGGETFGVDEDCGTLSIENGNAGKWLDHPCWQTNRRAVCEITAGAGGQTC